MGYYLSYTVEDSDQVHDGEQIASNTGWADFSSWALKLPKQYAELQYLAYYGECLTRKSVRQCREEIEQLLRTRPNNPTRNQLHIATRLLAAVHQMPRNIDGFVVTDGTEGPGEEEEEDETS